MPRYTGSDHAQANQQKRKDGRLGQIAQGAKIRLNSMKGMARQTHQSEMAEAEAVLGSTKLSAMPEAK